MKLRKLHWVNSQNVKNTGFEKADKSTPIIYDGGSVQANLLAYCDHIVEVKAISSAWVISYVRSPENSTSHN